MTFELVQKIWGAFLHEFKGHAIIARKGGEPGNEATNIDCELKKEPFKHYNVILCVIAIVYSNSVGRTTRVNNFRILHAMNMIPLSLNSSRHSASANR